MQKLLISFTRKGPQVTFMEAGDTSPVAKYCGGCYRVLTQKATECRAVCRMQTATREEQDATFEGGRQTVAFKS